MPQRGLYRFEVCLVMLTAAMALRCSLSVGGAQCETTADCVAKGSQFSTTICSTNGVCILPATGALCTSNGECIQKNGGAPAICRKDTRECASLVSEDCLDVVGGMETIHNDEALVFGFMGPLKDDAFGGAIFSRQDANALRLAHQDFADFAGLPPAAAGRPRRPLSWVLCDESTNPLRAAEHLVKDVGVQAIIGNAYSGVTIEVANTITIPNGVLQISASATSTLITDLDDNGLLWRTAPSDALQAKAQAAVLKEYVEPRVRSRLANPSTELKVSVINKEDLYGKALGSLLLETIQYNGKSVLENQRGDTFQQLGYGDSDSISAEELKQRQEEVVRASLEFSPHVVFIVGTGEGVDVLAAIENGWKQAEYRPFYILADGIPGRRVVTLLNATSPILNIKERVLGTTPGTTSPEVEQFIIRYQATYPQDEWLITGGTLGTFDAAYLIAYSSIANGSNLLTGSALASGLNKLLPPGPPIQVGFASINAAVGALQRGENVDLVGVSGPLDFNPLTGDCESDYQVWCPNEHNGYYVIMQFDAGTSKLSEPRACP